MANGNMDLKLLYLQIQIDSISLLFPWERQNELEFPGPGIETVSLFLGLGDAEDQILAVVFHCVLHTV